MGTRSDVGSMFAIGSVKEDFLGFDSLHLPAFTIANQLQDTLIYDLTG